MPSNITGRRASKIFVYVPIDAYDSFKTNVIDKYATDSDVSAAYKNKIAFLEKTRQLFVKGVIYDAGIVEIEQKLQSDINSRLKAVKSSDQKYLGVATSGNVTTLNVKKNAIHNYVTENLWDDYISPYLSGKNNNSNAFNIKINGIDTSITPSSNGSWNYDLGGTIITDANNMFNMSDNEDGEALVSLDVSNFDTSQVTNMRNMFGRCILPTFLDVSGFDTSNVTDMNKMFRECYSLTSLDVSNFDTSQVTNMYGMFESCGKLTSLDLSSFDTSQVTNMGDMFLECFLIESLNISSFNTSNVTNMLYMFNNCNSLTSLDVSNFDTSKVTSISHMFSGCTALTSLDVSNFDTSKVEYMEGTFNRCTTLTTLDLSNFNTNKVTSMSNMFGGCTALTSLDISNFDMINVNITPDMDGDSGIDNMFNGCTALQSVYVDNCNEATITKIKKAITNAGLSESIVKTHR